MDHARLFANRKSLYDAGLHNSYQRGIGRAKDGTGNMSIVLSGGYIDDQDFGTTIIYTGEGGRDGTTGAQVKDQMLTGGNKDLVAAFESGEPVYVTRGSSHKSDYSPTKGYVFAGEFYITEHWIEKGKDGFDIVRFKLVDALELVDEIKNNTSTETRRVEHTSTRIVRETKIAKKIKKLYDYRCQVCDEVINLPSGNKYAEAAHIRPLGLPHNGPDVISNLLCLCPNHHLMFDKYCYSIDPESFQLKGLGGNLTVTEGHQIDRASLKYHHENYLAHE